ncbi:MAG: ribonuclease [Frankiales bacterium]|nr:ribonuclease [Frankiales bacterium]
MMAVADPTLEYEAELHSEGARFVIGCDEVGRGAIAGPVAVGLCVVDRSIGAQPEGLRDSKMLSEKRREVLAPLASGWARFSAVGLATAEEVDRLGIMMSLGLAGKRALVQLHEAGASIAESVVLLDGSFDWLTPVLATPLRVRTRVKADRDCASVAAASVVAKVHRDRLMIDADARHPGYGWVGNKGYGSSDHYAAIAELGASPLHRHTWLHDRAPAPAPAPVDGASLVEPVETPSLVRPGSTVDPVETLSPLSA